MDTKHYTNLEISKKLKELGVKQEGGEIYWWKRYWNDENSFELRNDIKINEYDYRAFSVGELGDELLSRCNEFSQGWNDSGCYWHFQYGCRGAGNMIEGCGKFFSYNVDNEERYDSEADARGALLISIIEKNK